MSIAAAAGNATTAAAATAIPAAIRLRGATAGKPEPGGGQQQEQGSAGELSPGSRPGDRDEVEGDQEDQREDPSGCPPAGRPERGEGGQPNGERPRQDDHEPRPRIRARIGDRDVGDAVEAAADVVSQLTPVHR